MEIKKLQEIISKLQSISLDLEEKAGASAVQNNLVMAKDNAAALSVEETYSENLKKSKLDGKYFRIGNVLDDVLNSENFNVSAMGLDYQNALYGIVDYTALLNSEHRQDEDTLEYKLYLRKSFIRLTSTAKRIKSRLPENRVR